MNWKDLRESVNRLRRSRTWRLARLRVGRLEHRMRLMQRNDPAMAWAASFGVAGLVLSILLFLAWSPAEKPVVTAPDATEFEEAVATPQRVASISKPPAIAEDNTLPPDPFAPTVPVPVERPPAKFTRTESPFRTIPERSAPKPKPSEPEPPFEPAIANRPDYPELHFGLQVGVQRANVDGQRVDRRSPAGEGLLTRELVERLTQQPWPVEKWKQTALDRTETPVPRPRDRDWLIDAPAPDLAALARAARTPDALATDLPNEQDVGWTVTKNVPMQVARHERLSYQIVVQANSERPTGPLLVTEQLPRHVEILDVEPPAYLDGQTLVWHVATLPKGEKATFSIKLELPTNMATTAPGSTNPTDQADGRPQKVATQTRVHSLAALSAVTHVAPPAVQLALHCEPGAAASAIDETFRVRCTVTNIGSVAAKDVRIEADLPQAVEHPYGHRLKYELGQLAPGAKRTAVLIAVPRGALTESISFRATASEAKPVPQEVHIRLQQPPQAADTTSAATGPETGRTE